MFLASKAAWAGIVFILVTTGILKPPPTPLASVSQCQQRSAGVWESERCQEDAANSARQRTLPRRGRWRLRSPNRGEHSRISEG
jgi:hypothetical protein